MLHILASGSKGNCALVELGNTRVLIDCGLSIVNLTKRLAKIGKAPGTISALIITHEHGDHAGGLGAFRRKFDIPVYCNRLTCESLNSKWINTSGVRVVPNSIPVNINEVSFILHPILHDAYDPVAVTVYGEGLKIGIATDLGETTPSLERALSDCDELLIESNYDPEQLEGCDRPKSVIQRVAGRYGHLSNEQSVTVAGRLLGNLKTLHVGHISRDCNTPKIVQELFLNMLTDKQIKLNLCLPDL